MFEDVSLIIHLFAYHELLSYSFFFPEPLGQTYIHVANPYWGLDSESLEVSELDDSNEVVWLKKGSFYYYDLTCLYFHFSDSNFNYFFVSSL